MTASNNLRLLRFFIAAVVFITSFGAHADSFSQCEDPQVRKQMSLLEAAFAGPLYEARAFEKAQERFEENTQAAKSSLATQASNSKSADRFTYLRELEVTARRMTMRSLLEMMWEVYEPTAISGSNFRVEESSLPWQAVSLICQKDCPVDVRERLRLEATQIAKELKTSGVPRRSFKDTAEYLSTNDDGLTQVLKAAIDGNKETQIAHYLSFAALMTMEGVGRLWMTPTLQGKLELPFDMEKLSCMYSKKCQVPEPQNFTALDVRQAAQEYYQQLLYKNLRMDVFNGSSDLSAKELDEKIAEYYRLAPITVAKLSVEQPVWEKYHCYYLAGYLANRGSEQVWKLEKHEVVRLLPMGGFWLLGTGIGMFNKGKVSPLAFTFATIIGYAKIAMESYELSQENQVLSDVRTNAMTGQLDQETLLRYYNSLATYQKEKDDRDQEIIEEIAMLAISMTVARVVIYGVRGAFVAKTTADVIWKNKYRGKMFDFMLKRKIHNPEQLRQFLATASKHDLAEIKELLKTGYELTVPAAIMSIYEAWKAFDFKPYEINQLERGL